MKTVGVVQARMGSTRLPGKVMMDLGGVPVVQWSLRALADTAGVDQVVLATSTNSADDVVARWGEENRFMVVRGSEENVVSRFMKVANETKADILLRATGDCPFLDPAVIAEVVALRAWGNYDYCANVLPPSYPDGLDIECFTTKALEATYAEANNSTDLDTVTQYMVRNRDRFPAGNVTCPIPGLYKERWVLDSEEDLRFCRALVALTAGFGRAPLPYLTILDLLDKFPHIRKHNAHLSRNERFFAHLVTENKQKYSYARSKDAHRRALATVPLGAQTFSKSSIQYPMDCPLFVSHGDGAYVFDVDGNRFLDMVCGLLPNILGYRHPEIDHAIRHQLDAGISFSLSTKLEAQLAEKLRELIPCAEMSRFAKNGSDVTTAAVRLARACTGRDRIILIGNGYHGWQDWSIASTERNLGIPLSTQHYAFRLSEDLDKIETTIERKRYKSPREQIAAVIVEPEGKSAAWLGNLRALCDAYDVLLIFDEVITGFRWHLGGYQSYTGVTPDLACFGKAMANGMPISALVGKEDYMRRCAPPHNIFFSTTFGGETLSIAAALATIDFMAKYSVIEHLWSMGDILHRALLEKIRDHDLGEHVFIHGDAPRLHVKWIDPSIGNKLQAVWVKAMIDSGTLIINCNNMSWPFRSNELTHIMASYDVAFEAIKCALSSGTDTLTQTLEPSLVR
jgi:glutamate-1-semialdehyde 2,1-aminomutase